MVYRILSLDGGGTWALIQVLALIKIYDENTKGHRVLADFDMAAANSGGAIVLGALLEDLTLGQIRDYFLHIRQRQSLFHDGGTLFDKALNEFGIGPKYATEPKLAGLKRLMPNMGDKKLAELKQEFNNRQRGELRLLIIGFDYDHNRAVFFRSYETGSDAWGTSAHAGEVTLAEAIHASSTAPVNYFDSPAKLDSTPGRYWDGGITGQNNPVLAAVVEAVQTKLDPKTIAALSIGTGTVCLPDAKNPDNPKVYEMRPEAQNIPNDLKKLAKSILDDPPDAASFIAHVITYAQPNGESLSRIVRMSPMISPQGKPNNWKLPQGITGAQFQALIDTPMDAMSDGDVGLIRVLAEAWLDNRFYNQPIRMDHRSWVWELGHDKASDAIAYWNEIC